MLLLLVSLHRRALRTPHLLLLSAAGTRVHAWASVFADEPRSRTCEQ
jgi:hypothetical protein